MSAFVEWCGVARDIRATTKRLEKLALLERYLPLLDDASLAIAARFFSGTIFPRHDMRTVMIGGRSVWDALASIAGTDSGALVDKYQRHGDTGDLAAELLEGRAESGLSLEDVESRLATIAATSGSLARRALVRELLASLGALEASYFIKLVGGELRIGLKEAQVEEALARAFARELADVRRANLLRGDIGEVARRARDGTLGDAALALFHPIGFMLAQPMATVDEIVAAMPSPFIVEDKYDGIRAQAHVDATRAALFSRTLDEITSGYPEVIDALASLAAKATPGRSWIFDGELIAYAATEPNRPLPFASLQQRLGRRAPSEALVREVPVRFVVYDLLAQDGALVLDVPWRERRATLASLALDTATLRLAPAHELRTAEELERAFEAARAAGNEGLVVKDPSSAYTPGRRGKTWVKLKRATISIDVVVVAVERGHGRRKVVLSDYTFAVRATESDPTLLVVGKAYNGLTDAEIAALTPRFESMATEHHGGWYRVRPEIVLEVTCDIVQRSTRHDSGYAMRFPRIVRVREDKRPEEIDTLDAVRAMALEVPTFTEPATREPAAKEKGATRTARGKRARVPKPIVSVDDLPLFAAARAQAAEAEKERGGGTDA